jgi:TFIIF-interacting CTD phosphatase-like protein
MSEEDFVLSTLKVLGESVSPNLQEFDYLVLDLDETLIHTTNKCTKHQCDHIDLCVVFESGKKDVKVHIRSHAYDLIAWCCHNNIKIIVFSAGIKEYVEGICNQLFKDYKPIHILWRHHLIFIKGQYVKLFNLIETHTGVQMNRLMALDDNRMHYQDIPNRVIWIHPFEGVQDSHLKNVISELDKIKNSS